MAPSPGKRKSDTVDLTGGDGENTHPPKAGRVDLTNDDHHASEQSTPFIPLGQLSQASGVTNNGQSFGENPGSIPVIQYSRLSGVIRGEQGAGQNTEPVQPSQPSQASGATSNGQRFGQSTRLIPLSQISGVSRALDNDRRFGQNIESTPSSQSTQAAGADEDDAQAADLIQGSQDFDDDTANSYTLYGMFIYLPVKYLEGIRTKLAQISCRPRSWVFVFIVDMLLWANMLP